MVDRLVERDLPVGADALSIILRLLVDSLETLAEDELIRCAI